MNTSYCGYVAIIGRPNVGKSTLLNKLIGQKISITAAKPQTTRYQILGVKTTDHNQIVYVDTPGLHQHGKYALNRYMNRAASSVIDDVDVIIFVVDARYWRDEDEWILSKLSKNSYRVILALNKVDKVSDKDSLLPLIKSYNEKYSFIAIVPLSAKSGKNIDLLEKQIITLLPEGPHLFPDDQISDRSQQFFAAELIREKLTRKLGEELPYSLTVTIESFKEEKKIFRISAIIWVEKTSQKAIVIGKDGEILKHVGRLARLDMEKLFDHKVFLQLWVKVKEGWFDNETTLQNFGYEK